MIVRVDCSTNIEHPSTQKDLTNVSYLRKTPLRCQCQTLQNLLWIIGKGTQRCVAEITNKAVKFQRPCLDCGKLSWDNRCPAHLAAYNKKRNQNFSEVKRLKKKLLYGGDYQRRARAVKANATHCHICKQPFQLGDRIEADHINAGDPNSPLAPAHRLCNQRRGNKPLT